MANHVGEYDLDERRAAMPLQIAATRASDKPPGKEDDVLQKAKPTRHPAVSAAGIASVDHISNGRAVLGIDGHSGTKNVGL